jgi:hypothetical protein
LKRKKTNRVRHMQNWLHNNQQLCKLLQREFRSSEANSAA